MVSNRDREPDNQLTMDYTTSWDGLNITSSNVADARWDRNIRITLLWIQIVLGSVGGCAVCLWLWRNRMRKTRVNVILLHVTISDLLVMVATLAQVVWEMADQWWLAGDAMCRIVKFFQSFSMMASSNMLVLLSVDRHQAIRSPLRRPTTVWKMVLPMWALAAVLSFPMFALFKVMTWDSKVVCSGVFKWKPKILRQVFLTFVSVIHVFLPCALIAVCYVRIFLKISEKAHVAGTTDSIRSQDSDHPAQANYSPTLSRAKIKTLKMTVVIVTTFIVCGLPYHVLEMMYNFGRVSQVSPIVSAVLGALPVANSVVNPYVFLLFNTDNLCVRNTTFSSGNVNQNGQCSDRRKNRPGRGEYEAVAVGQIRSPQQRPRRDHHDTRPRC